MPGALVEAFEMEMMAQHGFPVAQGQRSVVENHDGRVVSIDHLVMRFGKPHLREFRLLARSDTDRRNTAAESDARATATLVGRAAAEPGTRVGRAAPVSATASVPAAATTTTRRAATVTNRKSAGQPKGANKSTYNHKVRTHTAPLT